MTSPAPAFAALLIGAHRLVLAQSDLRTLEPADDVDRADPPAGGVGWIESAARRWPVYNLDDHCLPSGTATRQRRICALLAQGDARFALLCDDVQRLPPTATRSYPLPPSMALPLTPLRGVVAWGDQRAPLTSAAALTAHMSLQEPV